MILNELYDILVEEISNEITGELSNDGLVIKWSYDSINDEFGFDESEIDYLEGICISDLEILKEYIDENDFYISEPTIEDTYISFYID